MRFGNETMLASGFVAEIEEDGVWRRVDEGAAQVTCWVKERRCVAGEHRFGGFVVQTVD